MMVPMTISQGFQGLRPRILGQSYGQPPCHNTGKASRASPTFGPVQLPGPRPIPAPKLQSGSASASPTLMPYNNNNNNNKLAQQACSTVRCINSVAPHNKSNTLASVIGLNPSSNNFCRFFEACQINLQVSRKRFREVPRKIQI